MENVTCKVGNQSHTGKVVIMFVSITAKINIRRSEPDLKEVEKEVLRVEKRNRVFANNAILKDLLKKPKKKAPPKRAVDMWEADYRLRELMPYLEVWNKWKHFYTGSERLWAPKNKSHMTCLENVIKHCDEVGVEFDFYIACAFKAFERRKSPLSVTHVLAFGDEWYNKFIDDVNYDIDQTEYHRREG